MFYLAHFLFESNETEDRSYGYFTCLAQAEDTDKAMDKFEDQILAMAETSDLFDEVKNIYLEDIIEFDKLPEQALVARFEMFAGERPSSANITLPEQTGADEVSFYRPISENEESVEGILVPFISFDDEE